MFLGIIFICSRYVPTFGEQYDLFYTLLNTVYAKGLD